LPIPYPAKGGKMKYKSLSLFNRDFYDQGHEFTYIGDGQLGGKASGLAYIKENVMERILKKDSAGDMKFDIPRLTVITTQYFHRFMELNDLYDIAFSDISDERMAHHFLKAQLPPDLTGDLWALITRIHSPLAVRSSSLLEDSAEAPFAGIYATKMIPNNQADTETRFQKLREAVKFVYASTYFNSAKSYMKATPHDLRNEKMAVIIQEVVGLNRHGRFYPTISGVARSHNFYPTGSATPQEGVVSLALGLGKTVVDGDAVWTYSPAHPKANPPYNSINDLLKHTQLDFWAVNMKGLPKFDPLKESEYLVKLDLSEADYDNTLTYIASTYDHESDRLNMGTGSRGPRVLNFAPILQVNVLPLNELIKELLVECKNTYGTDVEVEFALTIDPSKQEKPRFGLLQVRAMGSSGAWVDMDEKDFVGDNILAASEKVMGNGEVDTISHVLCVDPASFDFKNSRAIGDEITKYNRELVNQATPYLLIGFGRWGSSDPWLGIPVDWGQISGARVIMEAQAPNASHSIDLSQGSHFFHNISNLGVLYFSMKKNEPFPVQWDWLERQEVISHGKYVKLLRLAAPLKIKVDGRTGKGVIKR